MPCSARRSCPITRWPHCRTGSACLLANHGMIAAGRDLDHALALCVEVESLCEQYWRARQIARTAPSVGCPDGRGDGKIQDLRPARRRGAGHAMTSSQARRVETLRWCDGHLEMIDQRVLPAEFRYLRYDSAEAVAQGIRDMVVRGAPAIGCAAAYGVALEALRHRDAPGPDFAGCDGARLRCSGGQPAHRGQPVLGARAHAHALGVARVASRRQRRPMRCWRKPMKSSPKTSG